MGHTKKVGIAGKFGPRYGVRVRDAWRNIAEKQKGVVKCPKCQSKLKNLRLFLGCWECKKCGAKWTGGAWESATPKGKEAHRVATRLARELAEKESTN